MVKLFAISVIRRPLDGTPDGRCVLLKGSYDLASFGFFQRASVKEFMSFSSLTIVERTSPATRQSVKEQEFFCHVYVRVDGLSTVLVSDIDYPSRVAHTLMTKVLDDFSSKFEWRSVGPEALDAYRDLDQTLQRYQNPREADALTRIQTELDETKIIMHNTIEAVLERGEKLDDLVAKSDNLSAQSKMFYKTAKKTNSCCNF
ncbi:Synaptobrevin YKT6 [Orchesella cincta]|uniref:Synaptobrevin YKT6 n=1 Tax=Orchesella cincta TaxID=48709 RepID=A0A1D2N8V1_ORCCI|nr:Synaptobrevin YKT6 [Orchesella cincta]